MPARAAGSALASIAALRGARRRRDRAAPPRQDQGAAGPRDRCSTAGGSVARATHERGRSVRMTTAKASADASSIDSTTLTSARGSTKRRCTADLAGPARRPRPKALLGARARPRAGPVEASGRSLDGPADAKIEVEARAPAAAPLKAHPPPSVVSICSELVLIPRQTQRRRETGDRDRGRECSRVRGPNAQSPPHPPRHASGLELRDLRCSHVRAHPAVRPARRVTAAATRAWRQSTQPEALPPPFRVLLSTRARLDALRRSPAGESGLLVLRPAPIGSRRAHCHLSQRLCQFRRRTERAARRACAPCTPTTSATAHRPLDIVDDDQQGAFLGKLSSHPVQSVQHRPERRVRGKARGSEDWQR